MKIITSHRLVLQFDADQTTAGTAKAQLKQAVEQINLVLQRQPYGLGAQLTFDHDHEDSDVTIEDLET